MTVTLTLCCQLWQPASAAFAHPHLPIPLRLHHPPPLQAPADQQELRLLAGRRCLVLVYLWRVLQSVHAIPL